MGKFEFRENQVKVAKQIIDFYENGIDTVFLSSPTGSGKSGFANTIHKLYEKKTLILNHQKVLVDQYDDFLGREKGVLSIKGKDNYFCPITNDPVTSAICSLGKGFCDNKGNCEYYIKRTKFNTSPLAITNYQFAFSLLDSGGYKRESDICIMDECHNIESIFTDYRKVILNKEWNEQYSYFGSLLQKQFPAKEFKKITNQIEKVLEKSIYITDENYKSYFKIYYDLVSKLISSFNELELTSREISKNSKIQKCIQFITKESRLYTKWENYISNEQATDWILEINDSQYEIIPLFVGNMFGSFIKEFADKQLLMSATIIDAKKMAKDLGFDLKKTEFIEIGSEFPIDNRPIYFLDAVSLNYKNTSDENSSELSTTTEIIKEIVDNFSNDSGYVFAPSYRLCKILYEKTKKYLHSLGYKVLFNQDGSESEQVLSLFQYARQKTILFSPSFSEGVNFNDDISRFQIIVKTPYLSLGSKFVKTKMKKDQQWYENSAIITLLQVSGRSVRSKKDYASTFILDKNATRLITKNWKKLPTWYSEACKIRK